MTRRPALTEQALALFAISAEDLDGVQTAARAVCGDAYLAGETPGYAVSMLLGDVERRFVDVEPEAAYARAVLALLGQPG